MKMTYTHAERMSAIRRLIIYEGVRLGASSSDLSAGFLAAENAFVVLKASAYSAAQAGIATVRRRIGEANSCSTD